MRTQSLIKSYLELLKTLTGAESVNLFFPGNYALGLSKQLYKTGNTTLIEFTQDPQDMHSCNVLRNVNQVPGCSIYNARDSRSLLIELIPVSAHEHSGPFDTESRKPNLAEKKSTLCWVGLVFNEEIPDWLTDLEQSDAEPNLSLYPLLEQVLHLGALQMEQLESDNNLLIDPLTCLPSRSKFQSQVAQLINQHASSAVLMVHAAEFQQINKKFGHEQGDKVIWEISQNLLDCIRETDLVSRFGGALFAIAIPIESEQSAIQMAEKVQTHLQQPDYLDGALSLGFDVGVATGHDDESFSSDMERVTSQISRADQALKASQSALKPTITIWHPGQMDIYDMQQDYIGGIFTADTATDYRNMLLLWDISNIIASENDFDKLLANVFQRLAQTFTFQIAGVLVENHDLTTQLRAFSLDDNAAASSVDTLPAPFDQLTADLQVSLKPGKRTQYHQQNEVTAFGTLLDDTGDNLFFIMGRETQLIISQDTQMLFAALGKQIGRAHTRLKLEEQLNLQLEQQKHQLQEELTQLRDDIKSTNMYYCSTAMDDLMKQAKRAAQSDMTTLVIGESGTGKERLVKSLHKMGNRSDRPLIVVDCGAIPESLIESELFGHVKGAFTGAQASTRGKVREADGGTLMLDEIGELPLLMQTKLLRFVQEKQFTPVGGNKPEMVDVKILAVTNRELESEVAAGRFRQDLFYRLNVVTLRTPPLRERPEDIPLLAKHFLKNFARQFAHEPKSLSEDALQKMLRYSWPGNIRELENSLMQANLMAEGSYIDWLDLKIRSQQVESQLISHLPPIAESTANTDTIIDELTPSPSKPSDEPIDKQAFIQGLKAVLSDEIQRIQHQGNLPGSPIGKWLEDDLIYLTYKQLDDKAKMASLRLGVSLSTLRRKVDKYHEMLEMKAKVRTQNWHEIEAYLMKIATGKVHLATDCPHFLKLTLLDVILTQSPHNMAVVAGLLGVSEPTMYKLKKQLGQLQASKEEVLE